MSRNVLISVIVPVYNVGNYIAECLESVVEQDFDRNNYEVIIVNDGSTDNSRDIADRFANEYENIRLIDKVNGGLSSARNAGLEIANGDYVCFVDSDDYISKDYLSSLYNAAIEYQADIVFGDYHEVDQSGRIISKLYGKARYNKGIVTKESALDALTKVGDDHYATTVVVAWNKLVRRETMIKHQYPEGLLHEDEFVIMPLLMDCNTIVWIDDDIYSYRQRESSIMQDPSLALKHLVVLDAFKNRIEISKSLNNPELTYKLARAYYWDIEVWYYFMRSNYHVPKKSISKMFASKMREHMANYPSIFGKRKKIEYFIFTISPEFFLKHIYK